MPRHRSPTALSRQETARRKQARLGPFFEPFALGRLQSTGRIADRLGADGPFARTDFRIGMILAIVWRPAQRSTRRPKSPADGNAPLIEAKLLTSAAFPVVRDK